MNYEQALEEIEKTLEELRRDNQSIPIIVEGEKDIQALRKLGCMGEIIRYNQGLSMSNFCDKIAQHYDEVIILTDWDRRGGYLCHTIVRNIRSRVKCNTKHREIIATRATIKTVEGLPSWLEHIKQKIAHTNG